MWCRWSFAPLDRAVADGVQVHLEARGVQQRHVLAQSSRIHVGQAPVGGLAAARVQVGLDHPGGEALRDPVLHDLDGVRAEPAGLPPLAPGQDVGQLLPAPAAVPPEGPLDPGGQLPGRGRGQVDRQRVG
jgi:hypothetical protein